MLIGMQQVCLKLVKILTNEIVSLKHNTQAADLETKWLILRTKRMINKDLILVYEYLFEQQLSIPTELKNLLNRQFKNYQRSKSQVV